MPSISALTRIFFVSAACCVLFACGKANDQAPALNSVNKHPDTWLTGHRIAYRLDQNQCRGCHGTELKGGITKIDCFNQAGVAQCHANGHGPRAIVHPVPFKGTADLNKAHGALAKKDLTICQDCHGQAGGAGSNPRFNLVYGSLPAGCESSGCHNPKMAHPKPWQAHSSSGNQSNACALCHGANFEGSAANGAPSCKSCHTGLTAGVVPMAGQCASCHGNPPNGTATPNRAGSHAAHLALPVMSGNCAACHTGGGSGTTNHSTTLTMAFAATFGATASFNGNDNTCSNITCHGGLTSPVWGTSLDVIANCTKCHQPAVAYPGYHTGQHTKHLEKGILCTDCHDMTDQSAHFANVTTPVFETPPYSMLLKYLNYNQTAQSCSVSNPPPPGVQFTGCHSGTKSWP
ncbi:MAG TPA: CxxxxCH/CxxCH domain-containing protein [Desulfuromonadales bacterium]|nr:CxxxxCH/CxxCH domain-containing protein [Desulfuromonadales bacterium]